MLDPVKRGAGGALAERQWLPALPILTLFLLAVLLPAAFLDSFSNFRSYDDEGLFLLFAQLLLGGAVPYTEIAWIYGPVQVASVQFLHGLLQVPLDHAGLRWINILQWCGISLLAGGYLRGMTGSLAWGGSAVLLVFTYLASIVNEPGHPQAPIAIFLLFILCLGARQSGRPGCGSWVLLGVCVAAIALTKLNAGIFTLLAVAVPLLAQCAELPMRSALRAVLTGGAAIAPFVLMWPNLDNGDCLRFALIAAVICGQSAWLCHCAGSSQGIRRRDLAAVACGFSGLCLLATLYLHWLGTSPGALLGSLLEMAASQGEFYHHFRHFSVLQPAWALGALVAAISCFRLRQGVVQSALLLGARGILLLATLLCLLFDSPAISQSLFAWAGPWVWVVVVPARSSASVFPRLLLLTVAAWSPLLAYPIPGTQSYFGSFPIVLAALLTGWDLAQSLVGKLRSQGAPQRRRAAAGAVLPLLVLVFAGGMFFAHLWTTYTRYQFHVPLDLPGTGHLRVEPALARQYRQLAQQLQGADYVLSTTRFYSLYFWTDAQLPGLEAWSLFPLRYAEDTRQQVIREKLRGLPNTVVVDRLPRRAPVEASAAPAWVREDYAPFARAGAFVLLQPRLAPPE